ncbi:MAG: acetyltransferase [Bacteroidetes bacterium]|nr:MAG: acetyltransferase [Bacteroidota bacterium]
MNPQPIAIFGAGGQGREVFQLLRQINTQTPQWTCVGWFDDGMAKGTLIDGLPVLGGVAELNTWSEPLALVMAIALPKIKRKVVSLISNSQIYFPVLVHPDVLWEPSEVSIGEGSIITQGCRLTVNIQIGRFVLLNLCTVLTHDVVIGDFSSIMPSVNVSGAVQIGEACYVGTGTQIIQLLHIGHNSILGAGSVVTKDIPANCTAVGMPARPVKFHE